MDDLEAIRLEIKQQEEALAPSKDETLELARQERLAYERYVNVRAQNKRRKDAIDLEAYEKQKAINQLKARLQLAEAEERRKNQLKQVELAEIEAQKRADAISMEALLLNEKWDRLTANASWREWAKDHQLSAGHFITENRNVILADVMGLGKTLSSIITADMAQAATKLTNERFPFLGETKEVYTGRNEYHQSVYEERLVNTIDRPVGRRILYFCPKPLIKNVEKEFRLWAKHRNVTFLKEMTKAEKDFIFNFILKDRDEFVVICNYDAWRKDMNLIERFIDLNPDTVILDEAHNIKDMKSIAYRGIDELITRARPEYIIPMTGTPVLNRPQELFTLLHLVNPTEFRVLNDFLYSYCEQDDDKFWHFRAGGLELLGKKIRKNFMRRTKTQAGINLPPQTVINHDLELDKINYPNQARVRTEMATYATIMIDKVENKAIPAAAIIAMFTRLRQIETWPAGIVMKDLDNPEELIRVDVEESQKIDYIISPEPDENGYWQGLIPQAIEEERIVLFSQFVIPLEVIRDRIIKAGFRAVVLNGATPASIREEIEDDFNARTTPNRNASKWDIVLCNYKVGGAGLNFTAATQTIVLDEEWNPGKRDQAYGRTDRIGQENPTTVHVIRNKGTIDDWLAGIMEAKESLVDGFNDTMMDVQGFKTFMEDEGLI